MPGQLHRNRAAPATQQITYGHAAEFKRQIAVVGWYEGTSSASFMLSPQSNESN
jgi:hypothetical protein